jgi:hypothetical protein
VSDADPEVQRFKKVKNFLGPPVLPNSESIVCALLHACYVLTEELHHCPAVRKISVLYHQPCEFPLVQV